jgi:fructose-specific phosphotransferase system IIC component
MVRLDPDYIRVTGFVAGQVAGMLIAWFSLLEGDPPLLRLSGLPLLGTLTVGVTLGSLVGWYAAHRIAKRWID